VAEVPAPNKNPRGNDVGFGKFDEFTNFNIESCALVVAPSSICVTQISNIRKKKKLNKFDVFSEKFEN